METLKKECSGCKSLVAEFAHGRKCRECYNEYQRQWRAKNGDKVREHSAKWRENNKEHQKELTRQWRIANKERHAENMRRHAYKKLYGITIEQYEDMLDAQGYACALCLKDIDDNGGKEFDVDHCHTTGKVRGLLCRDCNRALGLFQDSPTLLERAAQYLRQDNGN